MNSNRNIVVRFKVTKAEKATIEAEAEHMGLSASSFIRLIIRQYADKMNASVFKD